VIDSLLKAREVFGFPVQVQLAVLVHQPREDGPPTDPAGTPPVRSECGRRPTVVQKGKNESRLAHAGTVRHPSVRKVRVGPALMWGNVNSGWPS
jgi:hypothetical protein